MRRGGLEDWFWQVSGDVLVIQSVSGRAGASRQFWTPSADLYEDESHFVVKVELAGVAPGQLQIAYLPDRHSLLVRGVRTEDDPTHTVKQQVHQLEIYYGEFEREIPIPDKPVEPDRMQAQYRSGFLYVLIPKAKLRVRHTRVTIHEV